MKRTIKKGSAIYEYLQNTGLLEHGSAAQIEGAKKLYWQSVRRQWKQQHRSQIKSYTIFLSAKQQRKLEKASKEVKVSINAFIKNSCLAVIQEQATVDKKTIGIIRASLIHAHTEIRTALASYSVNPLLSDVILNNLTKLQQSVFSVLHHHSNSAF